MKNLFLAILAIATVAACTHAEDTKKPIVIEEKFASLDDAVWSVKLPLPGSGVEVRKNELVLTNRAYVQTKQQFDGPMTISLKWTHEDRGGKRAYADVLMVTWKTTGALKKDGTRELMDGVQLRLTPGYGLAQLQQMKNGEVTELTRKEVELEKDANKAAWPEGAGTNWYRVTIEDDGTTVKASVSKEGEAKPFISVSGKYDPKALKGKSVVLGNREPKGGAEMTSFLPSVLIKTK